MDEFNFVTTIAQAKESEELLATLKKSVTKTKNQLEELLQSKILIQTEVDGLLTTRDSLKEYIEELTNTKKDIEYKYNDFKSLYITLQTQVEDTKKLVETIKQHKDTITSLTAQIPPLEASKCHLESTIDGYMIQLKTMKEDIARIEKKEKDLILIKQEIEDKEKQTKHTLFDIERVKKEAEDLHIKNTKQIEYLEFTVKPISFYIKGLQKSLRDKNITFDILEELRKLS